ncbi:catechol 2,3-dioxygenase-like lactoylglutathione lyase family enzyme [Actinoplanes octamycinicus]|uniref:Catechol 2,3-dioxygenase-like lactoylglutathione lyase family enzyme n=1 Tax=Actinoplanes octamycinicus TaxID=135948 RepID=A0A7W7H267_9ACTN|nr:VOC family protein [Actinoplanes octamycinicus]MBB4742625.1 catechol 2,3-dioxygenase-like lactoylglutathione lyase family enzyme [Actinoplanes octamycinicus]GIE60963.1 hypothetical protein Aoc01nite_63650 [Actinoplanes octamycinicus]
MALRLVQANLKARDDSVVGRFWAEALGWVARSAVPGATLVAPEGFVWTEPDAPVCLDVIAVPELATVRYRAYLELATISAEHRAALVARLRERGATPVDTGRDGTPGTVLADPEGNEFRVLEPRDAARGAGPIAAVVIACADPRAMARFWGEAMGWTPHEITADHARLRSASGSGPFLEFRRTSALDEIRHRLHLDVVPYRGSDQVTEVARLRDLGATPADVGQGDVSWVVLADPEGNEFCVLAPA